MPRADGRKAQGEGTAPSQMMPLELAGTGYGERSYTLPIARLNAHGVVPDHATVAEEVPVAFVYNGRAHVVVMATPADLEDLAVGFSLTEGIVDRADEVERLEAVHAAHGIELQMEIPAARAEALRADERARNMPMRSGCGLCGVEHISGVFRVQERLPHTLDVPIDSLWRASEALGARQTLNNETNTVHGAAWADVSGELQVVREDVGRHNALDKVLGALARAGTDAREGFVLVTSRASYEMVQKAAVRGVELVAAISRPTGLAIRYANAAGVTLVGLLRGRTANWYAGQKRFT